VELFATAWRIYLKAFDVLIRPRDVCLMVASECPESARCRHGRRAYKDDASAIIAGSFHVSVAQIAVTAREGRLLGLS